MIISASAAPAQTPASGWKSLKAGDSGHEVRALKLLLRGKNFDPGEIDTCFDPKTQEAVVSFQRQNGLVPDGTAGPGTWAKLITSLGRGEPSEGEGDAVSAVQYLLRRKYGFSSLREDGEFDMATKAALLLFQSNNNLGTNGANGLDGVVGPRTWSCLIRDSKNEGRRGWVIYVELGEDRGVPGTLRAFDDAGNKLLEMPCLGQSMTMDPDWRDKYADTPLGCFRASISQKWRNSQEYGDYLCVELNDADVSAVTNGRDRILIHSGANKYKDKPDFHLPHKYRDCRAKTIGGLDQTHGCVRISEADHASLINSLQYSQKGIVYICEA